MRYIEFKNVKHTCFKDYFEQKKIKDSNNFEMALKVMSILEKEFNKSFTERLYGNSKIWLFENNFSSYN